MLERGSPHYWPRALLVLAATWAVMGLLALALGQIVPAFRQWTVGATSLLPPSGLIALLALVWLWRLHRSAR